MLLVPGNLNKSKMQGRIDKPQMSEHSVSGGQQPQFQRLKVDDALSYLDQVKLQFSNQPQVYNDFLDIMKEFKSQIIDTPSVIYRVSNMFRSHPDLIVGFNNFLPPGYKIEVHCETISVCQQAMSISAQSHAVSTVNRVGPVHQTLTAPTASPDYQSPCPQSETTLSSGPLTSQQQQPSDQPVEFNHVIDDVNKIEIPGPSLAGGRQQQFQRLKVEDALSYLDQVKLQFSNQPQVYSDFLDIMKEFKSQIIDTPGVINRVSNLFRGHLHLIVGFNTFLPPGYKIELLCGSIIVRQHG